MVNNSTNINKKRKNSESTIPPISTKQKKNSDGQQFHQYQQNKRKSKQWWSTIPPISTKQKKVLNSDGQQFHQYQQNKRNL